MNIFFTSDTHFGHANIIKYCNRPFNSVEEMDERLIDNWNSVVNKNDTIYHLGDVSFNFKKFVNIVSRLNGNKILIRGNHDEYMKPIHENYFDRVFSYKEIKFNQRKIVLFHYPISDWNGKFHGSVHLHGHTHGNQISHGTDIGVIENRIDIGVDCFNYTPVNIEEIMKLIK